MRARVAVLVASALASAAGMVGGVTSAPASAYSPSFSADCDGVRLSATDYDPELANEWSVTIDGVTHSGTFGATLDESFPVPQGGATTDWSGVIEAGDGSQHDEQAGTVGPCGDEPRPPQPPPLELSSQSTQLACGDTVQVTETTTTTTPYVYDEATNTWVLGEPVTTSTTTTEPVTPAACDDTEVAGAQQAAGQPRDAAPPVAAQPPSVVASGVSGPARSSASAATGGPGAPGGAALALLAAGVVLGAAALRRTRV